MIGASSQIRPIVASDAHALRDLFNAFMQDGAEDWFHPHPFDALTAQRIAEANGLDYYCAAFDTKNHAQAYGLLRGYDEGFGIPSLGVGVRALAQGAGLGSLIVQHLHAVARLRGSKAVRLKVYPANMDARRLYERLGYRFDKVLTSDGQLLGFVDL